MIGTLIKLFTEDFWERRKEANKISSNVPVISSVCPSCGSKNIGKTTLTDNSYACKKCKCWWAN
jgi:transposase-like protein